LAGIPNFAVDAARYGVRLLCTNAEVDVDSFRLAVRRAEDSTGDERRRYLEEAESAYAGDLLEGFSDEWCEDERRVLRTAYEEVLRDLSSVYMEMGQYQRAVERLQRLVQMNPYDEDAHRELIRAYYVAGRRGAALSHFDSMRKFFLKELQSAPSSATIRLYDHIRAQTKPMDLSDDSKSLDGSELVADLVGWPNIPIIGRARELAQMTRDLDRAFAGDGSAAIVCGDIGVGKTKLVEAVMVEAKLRGFEVLVGTCPDLEYPPPYHVLIQALWPRLRGRSGSSDSISIVVDEIARNLSLLVTTRPNSENTPRADSAVLNEFVVSLLTDSHSGSSPTLLVLEDIHRIDGATEGLLLTLLARVRGARFYLLLSARRGEGNSDRIVASVLSAGARVIELAPASKSDIPMFVRALLGDVVPEGRLVEFLYERTSGVALFMVELLKFLVAERYVRRRLDGGWLFDEKSIAAENWRVPSRVLEVIRRRISRLTCEQRKFLSVAAVVGSEVPFEILERLLGVPEDRFVETVEGLLSTHLLGESGHGLRFPHESIRTAALSALSRARLRTLHAKTAAILETLAPSKAIEIAWHHREAGNLERAAHFFEVSGDRARALHANEDAARYYSQAVSCIRDLGSEEQDTRSRLTTLLLKRCEVLDLAGDRGAQAEDINAIIDLAAKLGDRLLLGRGFHLRSQVQCRMNQNELALMSASEAGRLFEEAGDTRGGALAAEAMGLVHLNLRNQTAASHAFQRALRLFRKVGDRSGEARALVNLATTRALAGENVVSLVYLDQAEGILRGHGDKRTLAAAILQKGILYRYLGECVRSEALLRAGIGIMEEIGDKVGQARGRSQLSCTRVAMGNLREGLREAQVAMRLAREAKDVRAMIVILNNTAFSSLRCLGSFQRAERFVRGALRMVIEDGGSEDTSIYYDTMAGILLSKGDYEGALRWGRQAMSQYKRVTSDSLVMT